MKKALIFAVLQFFCFLQAQEITVPVRFANSSPAVPGLYIGKDTFDWQYTVSGNTLRKQKGDQYVEFKTLSLGEIHSVDILNPLQVVVFYKSFNTVVLLDNQLNETSRVNFSELTQQDPIIAEASGLAGQNQLWIFNINTQRLGLYNLVKKEFRNITPPFSEQIAFSQSDYNYFYWIDKAGKFYVCNLFGKINFLGNVPAFEMAQALSQNNILLKVGNNLYIYNTRDGSLKRMEIVEKTFESFYYAGEILSIFTDTEIKQYKVIIPE